MEEEEMTKKLVFIAMYRALDCLYDEHKEKIWETILVKRIPISLLTVSLLILPFLMHSATILTTYMPMMT